MVISGSYFIALDAQYYAKQGAIDIVSLKQTVYSFLKFLFSALCAK